MLQAAIAAVAKAAAAEFALDGYANGGDVSDSSNDSDAATTTDLHLRGGGSISQGQFGGQSGSYRVGRRASANTDLSTLSSSWRASDCMPFGGGGGGNNVAPGLPHRGSVYGGAVRMSLEGVSTSDGRCALHASHCAGHLLHLDRPHVNLPLFEVLHVSAARTKQSQEAGLRAWLLTTCNLLTARSPIALQRHYADAGCATAGAAGPPHLRSVAPPGLRRWQHSAGNPCVHSCLQ